MSEIKDQYNMDGHKLLWHLDRVNEFTENKRIAPLHVDFGIATGCNMGCKYCYGVIQGRDSARGGHLMPKEKIVSFLKDAKEVGVRSVAFIGEGENTLNPALYDSLNYAKSINLDVSLATNGIEIKHDRIKDMLESLVWIRFNISAATVKSFYNMHKIREEGFNKILDNIKRCVETKKKYNLNATIGLQMVLMHDNIDDIVPLAKLGKELGVDYLVVKPTSDTYDKRLKSPDKEYKDIIDIFKEAESYSDEKYLVSIKWSKMMNEGKKDYDVCYGTKFIIAISGNGNVFPCGHWFAIKPDEYLMGNIEQQSFKDIVRGDRYWEVQKKIEKVDVIKDCETNCRQHYTNQFLQKLKRPPSHINFI